MHVIFMVKNNRYHNLETYYMHLHVYFLKKIFCKKQLLFS